jgi:hypothetical protein
MTGFAAYRIPRLPETPEPPPRELEYAALDRDRERGFVVASFQLFSLPLLLGLATASALTPWLGLAATIGGVVFSLWHRRSSSRRAGAVLRVEEGQISILSRDRRTLRSRFPLRELADVALDLKAIRRVQDGASLIPAVRFTDTTVGPEIDTARIVFIFRGARNPIELTAGYFAHIDATEWMGKIRVFLRGHGWTPEDEREVIASAQSS